MTHIDRRSSRGKKNGGPTNWKEWLSEDMLVRRSELAQYTAAFVQAYEQAKVKAKWYRRFSRWFMGLFKRAGNEQGTKGSA